GPGAPRAAQFPRSHLETDRTRPTIGRQHRSRQQCSILPSRSRVGFPKRRRSFSLLATRSARRLECRIRDASRGGSQVLYDPSWLHARRCLERPLFVGFDEREDSHRARIFLCSPVDISLWAYSHAVFLCGQRNGGITETCPASIFCR